MDVLTLDPYADRDSLTMLPNGGYVVTWRENEKIAFQLYDGTGAKVGGKNFVDASSGKGQQFSDVVSYTADGGFAITWTEGVKNDSGRTLRTQKFKFDGLANGDATSTSVSAQTDGAQIATNGNGWGTVYIENVDGTNTVRLIQFDQNGTAGNPVSVSTATGIGRPDVTWLGGTKYAVSFLTDTGTSIRIVDGNTVGDGANIAGATESKVVALKLENGQPSGQFVVVTNAGQSEPIIARTFTTNPDGSATLARTTTISPVQIPALPSGGDKVSVTALRDGGYAVAYVSTASTNPDIWVKVVDVNGQEGPAINVSTEGGLQTTPSLFEMVDGRLAVSWNNPSYPTYGVGGIETRIVDARAAKVTVTGTSKNDIYAASDHAGDTLNGGDGIDTLTFQAAASGVAVDLAQEGGTAGIAAGDKYTNFENIIGSNFADTLIGSAVSNTINGGAGNDVIDSAGGVDEMNGGTGADIYYVDDTADRINESAAADIDTVYTSATYALSAYIENLFATGTGAINLTGNDLNNTIVGNEAANGINGGNGNDVLHGAGGNDVLNAGAGNDVLEGGTGADILSGGDGIDALNGGDDNDTLSGGEGADNLNGGNGDDVMQGGGGADVMNGGAGNDTYYIDDVNDQVVDGAGVDTVYLGVSYDVSRLGAIENITGIGAVDITLTGNAFNNVLTGNDGANILIGGAGNDVLYGGAGNDRIHGQEGNDILAGGGGRDLFVFDKAPHKSRNVDKIMDYSVRDDSIYVENKYFKVGSGSLNKPKKMESKYFFKGTKAHDRDDRLIYDQKKGVLYYDPDGTGSKAQIKVATFEKKPALNINEFFVI
jgi:Ca2+-binding RTX toxin-like protein